MPSFQDYGSRPKGGRSESFVLPLNTGDRSYGQTGINYSIS